jgi:hypothetical protein
MTSAFAPPRIVPADPSRVGLDRVARSGAYSGVASPAATQ